MKTNRGNKLKMHLFLSALTIVFGVALLVFMIVTEDEPGAIPLLLILVGAGWYFITRYRIWSKPKESYGQKS